MLAECLSFLSTSIITAMYAIIPQQIPQGKRAEINEKILFAINSGKDQPYRQTLRDMRMTMPEQQRKSMPTLYITSIVRKVATTQGSTLPKSWSWCVTR